METLSVASSETEMVPLSSGSVGLPRQTMWKNIDTAKERIKALLEVIGPMSQLEALLESEMPGKGLLQDDQVAVAVLAHLARPGSGRGQDSLCQWLYDTFQTNDIDLQMVVLRFIPALCGLYLPRVTRNSDEFLAGFEAVLLALYTTEVRARNGCPVVINIPDLSQPSLYHAPRIPSSSPPELFLGQLSSSLEPQDTVKATKRTCIVGVALDLFCRKIAHMPHKAKVEACQCINRWGMLDNQLQVTVSTEVAIGEIISHSDSCHSQKVPEISIVGPEELFLGSKSPNRVLDTVSSHKRLMSMKSSLTESAQMDEMEKMSQNLLTNLDFPKVLMQAGQGIRVQLPWELLQPLLHILGHCLLGPLNTEEVREAASVAIRSLHRRVSHDLIPEAILATRSLVRLESASKMVSKTLSSTSNNSISNSSKPRKPEVLLVSK